MKTVRFVAVPPSGGRGGSTPGHTWSTALTHAFHCEGVAPFAEGPQFYPRGHADIAKGEPYLRKLWRRTYPPDPEGQEQIITTRHCRACAGAFGARPALHTR